MMGNLDWTHKNVSLLDIRKLNKLYVIKLENQNILPSEDIQFEPITSSLFVNERIFEERLTSYFLKDISRISRDEIMNVRWNMYITKGYYIKLNESGEIIKHNQDENKYYVSYLEIDGALGSFCSICRDKE